MIGILFFAVALTWLGLSIWMSRKAGDAIAHPRWRAAVRVVIFIAMFALPFLDEVIGRYQFQSLCKAKGIESADISKARGKRVKPEYSEPKLLKGTIVPIRESDLFFRDVDNGEVLIRLKNYSATGGWVMRHTWLGLGSNTPVLFDGSTCDVRKEQEIFKSNSITFLYK